MGYRLYIGKMPKRQYNKIKKMTRPELWNYYNVEVPDEIDEYDEPYLGVYDLGTELYGFGKYVDFYDKKTCKPFFKNKETYEYYNQDWEIHIVTKEFLEAVIEDYKERVKSYYNNMTTPFFGDGVFSDSKHSEFLNSVESKSSIKNNEFHYDYTLDFTKITQEEQTALWKMIEHIRSFRVEWTHLSPFDLHNDKPAITTSWKFEYGIFELVRIYKSFDWKKDVMYYYGW